MDYRQEYDKWCNDPYFDDQTREELKQLPVMTRRSRIVFIVHWSLEPPDCAG
mgnify:FL=1